MRRWNEIDSHTRRVTVLVAALDAGLRIAALVDLARRADAELRGSRAAWRAALAVVSSAGIVPAAYFLVGRHGDGDS